MDSYHHESYVDVLYPFSFEPLVGLRSDEREFHLFFLRGYSESLLWIVLVHPGAWFHPIGGVQVFYRHDACPCSRGKPQLLVWVDHRFHRSGVSPCRHYPYDGLLQSLLYSSVVLDLVLKSWCALSAFFFSANWGMIWHVYIRSLGGISDGGTSSSCLWCRPINLEVLACIDSSTGILGSWRRSLCLRASVRALVGLGQGVVHQASLGALWWTLVVSAVSGLPLVFLGLLS